MENMQTELRAADTILQRGVKVKARAPWLLRLIGLKFITMTIKQPTAGTMMRVSTHYLRTGISADQLESPTIEEAMILMAVYGNALRKAVATSILNGWLSGMLLTRPMAWYLKWHLTDRDICLLMDILVSHSGVADFMDTTRYIRAMKITAPNLGHKEKKGS